VHGTFVEQQKTVGVDDEVVANAIGAAEALGCAVGSALGGVEDDVLGRSVAGGE
jgi:hypothetical protein